MKRSLLLSLIFPLATLLDAAEPVLQNVAARRTQSLNGEWRVIVDPYDNGAINHRAVAYDASGDPKGGFALDRHPADKSELIEYDFDRSEILRVPGDWNSQDQRLFFYEGSLWYRRKFDCAPTDKTQRVFLHFGAANYQADVYLNGHKLGRHVGGFTPFNFEVTGVLRERDNSLVVRVDNRRLREGVPTLNTDWWNYGGLTRDVTLVTVPATFVRDYAVGLAPGATDRLAVSVQLDGATAGAKVRIDLPELQVSAELVADGSGQAHGEIAARPDLWSPERPRLYGVIVTAGADRMSDRVGFRTVATRGADILLNGQPIFLRGISIHEENPLRGGRAWSEQDARLLLGWAKELHCNFVRLAHYPHNEHMARLADEMGLLVWEEVPVYWTIEWENPGTLANARQQLAELIGRDRNRASVIVWSVANETPPSEPRLKFLRTLVEDARRLDPTRLISAAMEVRSVPGQRWGRIVDDAFGGLTDLVSFNEYVGWYDGLPPDADRVEWRVAYEKPVVISEFGADALAGFHGDALTRFSEEYQADVYRRTLRMLPKIPQLRGMSPWILADFRSPRRQHPEFQQGWNRKGLISSDGTRKQAFGVLRDWYEAVEGGQTPAEAAQRLAPKVP